jgi:X-Pro dipeptidyl-peptidase C-terminal non-catalytic domain
MAMQEMSDTGLTVPGMTEPPRLYDVIADPVHVPVRPAQQPLHAIGAHLSRPFRQRPPVLALQARDQPGHIMAGRARREEVGLLLQRAGPAAPAGVLRPLPQRARHRGQRLAAGALPGQGLQAGRERIATDWPVPGPSYLPLYLDAGSGTLSRSRPAAASVSYDSERAGNGRGRATFDFRFDAAAEVVGGMKLRVWMSAPDADDLDVFVAVQKLDAYGDLVGFPFCAVFEDGPVALGWLRASHRELDQARSRPWQPVLAHRRSLPIAPGEIVPLEIEILPSGTRFGSGETLRLVIQGRDIYRYPRPLIQAPHDDLTNAADTSSTAVASTTRTCSYPC